MSYLPSGQIGEVPDDQDAVHGAVGAPYTTSTHVSNHASPMRKPPLGFIEFPKQPHVHSASFLDHDAESLGETTQTPPESSSDRLPASQSEGQFRLMPRKPHLLDGSPELNTRGRKRSAQSMCNVSLLRDTPPVSPMTSNMMYLQNLSLHSPTPSRASRSSGFKPCQSVGGHSAASSFSKAEGSPFREYCSSSINSSFERPMIPRASPDMPSQKIVPLKVLPRSSKPPSTPSNSFLSPRPQQTSRVLPSPFTLNSPRPWPATPESLKKGIEASMSTPESLNETPLPRISLTPRSSSSRTRRGGVPRFPSPTDEVSQHIPSPPTMAMATRGQDPDLPQFPVSLDGPFVSMDSTLCDSKKEFTATEDLTGPSAAGRSLLGPTSWPLDSFLINKSEALSNTESESLSDGDDDDFFLAFPSKIIEEKQQQQLLSRQAKQPRTNHASFNRASMASAGSLSVSSLLGVAFATSENNLHEVGGNSMSSLNYGDFPPQAKLKRNESCASIGLTLDVALTGDVSRSDLVTPPVETADLFPPPPPIGRFPGEGTEEAVMKPMDKPGSFAASSLFPKQSPPASA